MAKQVKKMKRMHNDFRSYLMNYVSPATGKLLTPRVVSDILSRCRKIENFFGIELNAKLAAMDGFEQAVAKQVRDAGEDFSGSANAKSQVMYALRYYIAFSKGMA